MINHIGAMQTSSNIYATQAKLGTRPAGVPADAKEAFSIDLDKLFTPSERKTLENMKEHLKAEGANTLEIEVMEAMIVHTKHAEKSIGNDMSIKDIVGQQIRGIQDGHINENSPSLEVLYSLYNNFAKFQGVAFFA